jgi:hypothetical protein
MATQSMKKQVIDEHEEVVCPVCKKSVGVRVGWIDPYVGNIKGPGNITEPYVHFECLSEKRKEEIRRSINRSAVKMAKEAAMSGGFDIVQKLFKKQHQEQQKKQKKEKKNS